MLQVNATILQLVNIKSKWRNPTRSAAQHRNNTLINRKETLPLDKALFFFNLTENFISNLQTIGVKQIQN